ncbi:MAG: alpha/beta hydrolase [Candidatus Sulfotelmatobacter sp.]
MTSTHLHPVPPLGPLIDEHDGYTVELLQLQWRRGDPLDLYVIKPKGIKKPPVILHLYGYPADTDAFKNEVFQNALTKDGFAAVGFVSALTGHRYHDRPMKQWFLSELQESLATSAHDVQMVLNYLTGRDDLDMSRVGMFGQGSGATVAILASAVDPRIKVLDVLDPWGDWPIWLRTSPFVPEDERQEYIKPEFFRKTASLDPLGWLPRIQAKEFRLQQAAFETDTPKAAKEQLRSAVPARTKFVLYNNPQEFKKAFQTSTNLEWMEDAIRSLSESPSSPSSGKKF